jgi:hypothetical protein
MTDDGWTGTPNLPAVVGPTVGNDPEPAPALLAENTGALQRGRPFQPGQSGNPAGRPKGARNRLKEAFLKTIADDFEKHGVEFVAKLRVDNPDAYGRLVASFVPRETVSATPDFGDLTYDEIVEVIRRAEQHRLVVRMIEAGEKNP